MRVCSIAGMHRVTGAGENVRVEGFLYGGFFINKKHSVFFLVSIERNIFIHVNAPEKKSAASL